MEEYIPLSARRDGYFHRYGKRNAIVDEFVYVRRNEFRKDSHNRDSSYSRGIFAHPMEMIVHFIKTQYGIYNNLSTEGEKCCSFKQIKIFN
jgi:hypothetical protein